jgi:RNA-directed DNA polymerase
MQSIEQIYRHNDWWDKINWSQIERDVRRLQGRIYRASKKGDNKRVDNLMKLLVRSETAKLLAIYVITQKNKGKATAGIDGKTYLTSKERMVLSREDFDYRTHKFQPILRRFIPKTQPNWRRRIYKKNNYMEADMRPLGIMTIKDRIMATIILFALTAKWEALLEPNVMGFRPGRCTQDAIQRIYLELIRGDKIILDADINKFFDNIRHTAVLNKVKVFRKALYRCLNVRVIEKGKRMKTVKGIVQGSPLSPILANIALNGMQKALGNDICVISYADDLIIIASTVVAMK